LKAVSVKREPPVQRSGDQEKGQAPERMDRTTGEKERIFGLKGKSGRGAGDRRAVPEEESNGHAGKRGGKTWG